MRFLITFLLAVAPLWAGDLDGKWNFTWDTEGGVRGSVVELQQDGERLTGSTGETKLSGTVVDGRFQLSGKLYSPEAGYTGTLEFSGVQDGDQLKGKGSWDVYAVTFTAQRAK